MGFQNNSFLAIFIPQTNPLLIHMMKTSIVDNVIRRPLARPGLCLLYFSKPFRHGRQDDKLTAYRASWEGCKLWASEFSSGATRMKGLWKTQNDMAVRRNNIQRKDRSSWALNVNFCNWEDFSGWKHLCVHANQLKVQLPYSYGQPRCQRKLLLSPKVIALGNYEWLRNMP